MEERDPRHLDKVQVQSFRCYAKRPEKYTDNQTIKNRLIARRILTFASSTTLLSRRTGSPLQLVKWPDSSKVKLKKVQFLWKEGWTPDLAEVLGVGKSLHNRRLSAVALVHNGWVRALIKLLSLCFVLSSPPRWYCWTGSVRRSRGRSGCALPPRRPTLGSSRPAQCPAGTRCGSSMSSWPAPPWATCVTCVPARWWCPPPQPQASPPLWPQAPVHHWWWERQGWTPEHEDDADLLGGEVVHLQGLWGQVADYSHFSATNLREEEREVFLKKTTRIAKAVQYHSLAVL